jgi:intracellular sulfur oxidation DsrE/DsrF family protein
MSDAISSLPSFFGVLLVATGLLALGTAGLARAQDRPGGGSDDAPQDLFVVVSSESPQTQMMAMVLSNQAADRGASVRVLLCDAAGELAVEGASFPTLKPADRSPQDLLRGLMEKGATVEVCAIFLPNTDHEASDLLDGVGTARPGPVADYMMRPGVRYFTF